MCVSSSDSGSARSKGVAVCVSTPVSSSGSRSGRSKDWCRAASALLLLGALSGCVAPAGPPEQRRPEPRSGRAPVLEPGQRSAAFDFLLAIELEREGRFEEALAAYRRVLTQDSEAPAVLRRLAELSMLLGRAGAALGWAERALAVDPDQDDLRLLVGAIHGERGDADAVREVLTGAEGSPISVPAAAMLYGVHAASDRYGEALPFARWLVEHEPDEARGYLLLARAHDKLGDPSSGERALRQGLGLHPGHIPLYTALAALRRARGDRIGEIGIYREWLVHHPGHRRALLAKAEAELATGREQDARLSLETLEGQHPLALEAVLKLAFLDYDQGAFEAAEARFARVHRRHPGQADVAFALGVVRRQLGKHAAAIEALEAIPRSSSRYGAARVQMASVFEARGALQRALETVAEALEAAPDPALELERARLLHRTGQREQAFAWLESLLDGSTADAGPLYQTGLLHAADADHEAALRSMERVLEHSPDHPGALNFVGYTLAERGENLDQAERLIARALELRPDDGFITDSLGWVYFQRAQPLLLNGHIEVARTWLDRAEAELLRAQELTGGDPVISEHLGDVCLALGRRDDALAHYEKAVSLGPREGEQPELAAKLERLRAALR